MQLFPTYEKKMIYHLPGGSTDQRFRLLLNYFGLCLGLVNSYALRLTFSAKNYVVTNTRVCSMNHNRKTRYYDAFREW